MVIEFDDRRHASKVFGQQDSIYLRYRAGDLIEAVIYVEPPDRDRARQKLAFNSAIFSFLNADVRRADLFGVADDQDLFPRYSTGKARRSHWLAVHDDHVKGAGFLLEGLNDGRAA